MRRRDFLARSIGMACTAMPIWSVAKPCAPVLLDQQGRPIGSTACGAGDAEADWQARIAGPGVIWFHDFRSDDEVNNFRWNGGIGNDPGDTSDPGLCRRNTELGITGGGCLELIHPAGAREAPSWWRPFGAIAGGTATGNGRGEDDPAAGGSLPLNAWDPRNRGENEGYRKSYYAHPDYVGKDGFSADRFDGNEFWLQYRFRYTASRRKSGTPDQGKLAFIATTQQTLNQELVIQNERDGEWRWYTNFGSSPDTGGSLGDNDSVQPGGNYASCGTQDGSQGCWVYPIDEWVTFLIHVVPGHDGVRDTTLQVYVARAGQTAYETLYDAVNTIAYSEIAYGHPKAYNAFQPSNYMNGQNTDVAWSQFYDQIIFSRDIIPCPKV